MKDLVVNRRLQLQGCSGRSGGLQAAMARRRCAGEGPEETPAVRLPPAAPKAPARRRRYPVGEIRIPNSAFRIPHWLPRCLIGIAAVFFACTPPPSDTDARPIVAVSVPPQAYFVERLAGDLVRIEVMLPPGASPHTHEPAMQQMRAVAKAALYVEVGHPSFPFERTWMRRLLAESPGIVVVDCARQVPLLEGDPHLWLSPAAALRFVPDIAAALMRILPEQETEIEARGRTLVEEIRELDGAIRAELADLPSRRFYVFHPAWSYFARDYGLEQISIEVDAKEPDPHTLAGLIGRAQADRVRVIFVQPQFSRRSAELVAAEVGGRVVVIDPLARNWAANLRHAAAAFRQAMGA